MEKIEPSVMLVNMRFSPNNKGKNAIVIPTKIDSGAPASLISEADALSITKIDSLDPKKTPKHSDIVNWLDPKKTPKHSDIVNTPIHYTGRCNLWLAVSYLDEKRVITKWLLCELLVADNITEHVIIGADFLQTNAMTVNPQFNQPFSLIYQGHIISNNANINTFASDADMTVPNEPIEEEKQSKIFKLFVKGEKGSVEARCRLDPSILYLIISRAIFEQTCSSSWEGEYSEEITFVDGTKIQVFPTTSLEIQLNDNQCALLGYIFVGEFDTTDFDIVIGNIAIQQYGLIERDEQIFSLNYENAFRV